jgi:hypothetical protein
MNNEKLSEHIDLIKGKVIYHTGDDSSDEFLEEGKSGPEKMGHIEMTVAHN